MMGGVVTAIPVGFSILESGSELPVKQNHYAVNPQSVFI